MSGTEKPGERLARIAVVLDMDGSDIFHALYCIENCRKPNGMPDIKPDTAVRALDRLARDFLRSYGIEVPE